MQFWDVLSIRNPDLIATMTAARIAELEKRLAQAEARIAELERNQLVPEPPFQRLSCGYCKEYGHHVDHCFKAFTRRIKGTKDNCYRGWHDPYQHGADWRCNCCGKHMSDAEAKQYPVYPRRVKKQFADASTQSDTQSDSFAGQSDPPYQVWQMPQNAQWFTKTGERKCGDFGCWCDDSD